MENKRVDWVDTAKGLGMLFVLIFHALPEGTLYYYFASFHLPLFSFLSGFVYSEKYSKNFESLVHYVKKKIRATYVPFVSYSLAFMLLHNLFCQLHFIGSTYGSNVPYIGARDYLNKSIDILTMGGGESLTGPLWYLIPLLELTTVFAFICFAFVNRKKDGDILVMLSCVLGYIIFSNLDMPRHMSNAFRLMLFYMCGFFYKKYGTSILKKLKELFLLCIIPVAISLQLICLRYSTDWQGNNLLVVFIAALSGIIMTIAVSMFITSHTFAGISRLIQYIGQNTMCILPLHLLAYSMVRWVFVHIYNLPLNEIEHLIVLPHKSWTGVYVIAGVVIPLTINLVQRLLAMNLQRLLSVIRNQIKRRTTKV